MSNQPSSIHSAKTIVIFLCLVVLTLISAFLPLLFVHHGLS